MGPAPQGNKLATFWAAWLPTDDSQGIATRCLVVKLAAEVADLSQDMRRILDDGVAQLTGRIADLLRQGAADGSIRAQDDPDTTARTLYAQWLGAAVLSKLSSGDAPLRLALQDTARRLHPTQ
ncbi:TetR family transcriptional regulator C-terminal domain-containing protein [Loktanella salsilacus]|uniref:TetR family transcriptional regulator C-terminal domain-containing protein n=1 Tax=Loktanella salsilacus TaxID=195913 RepID=UPI0037359260